MSSKDDQKTPIIKAIEIAGGVTKFAKAMTPSGLSRMTVYLWKKPGGRVPAEYCPDIERLTGVKCEELRPDVAWWVLRGKNSLKKSSELDGDRA